MQKIISLLFIMFLMAMASCGQFSQEERKEETIKKRYKDWKVLKEPEFVISYPDTFELRKLKQMGLRFVLLSRQTSPQDSFRENINLIIQDLSRHNLNLDEYGKLTAEQVEKFITDGKLLVAEKVKDGNNEYFHLIYTGRQGQKDLKWEQYIWIKNGKAYILTLTAELDAYEDYAPVGKEIMQSFIIK